MDRRAWLERLAVRLHELVMSAEPGACAGLARELRLVLAELDGLTARDVSVVDDLGRRRALRRSDAAS